MIHTRSGPGGKGLMTAAVLLLAGAALLRFPGEAAESAREGLALCGSVLLPGLFPFFVLSSLLVETGLAVSAGRALSGVLRPLFRISGAGASALILGLLGGYPVGVHTAVRLFRQGLCTQEETERLLAFCSNAGPAFLVGVAGVGILGSRRAGVLLLLVHAAAAAGTGLLFRFYGSEPQSSAGREPLPVRRLSTLFPVCVSDSFFAVLRLCAFVILFSVILRLLRCTGLLPLLAEAAARVLAPLGLTPLWAEHLLTGMLEVTTGLYGLAASGTLSTRLTAAAFLLGWGGLSVHCQTLSMLEGTGLSSRTCLAGKLLHGILSAGLMAAAVRICPEAISAGTLSAVPPPAPVLPGGDTVLRFSSGCAAMVLLSAAALCRFGRKNSGKPGQNVL